MAVRGTSIRRRVAGWVAVLALGLSLDPGSVPGWGWGYVSAAEVSRAAVPPPASPVATAGDRRRSHWAFQPLRVEGPPSVRSELGGARLAGAIDAFIADRLQRKGLPFPQAASRRALIRRVTYDLTGLPPTPEDVEAFVHDPSPLAWEHLVDRLLESPHYGEKWGRHWLDLVRFAETNSYETDEPKPHAWRYRDYVIRAFN
ncbi:MAG: DUF1549 domain-containing protein, partial [Gemmataceae bacterium]|nr:DUF1549 domain-containing protein [Gemmataceae bacterium]